MAQALRAGAVDPRVHVLLRGDGLRLGGQPAVGGEGDVEGGDDRQATRERLHIAPVVRCVRIRVAGHPRLPCRGGAGAAAAHGHDTGSSCIPMRSLNSCIPTPYVSRTRTTPSPSTKTASGVYTLVTQLTPVAG